MNIGITQRVDAMGPHKELRDALDQRLISWVIESGCNPIPIPNNLIDQKLYTSDQSFFNNWMQD